MCLCVCIYVRTTNYFCKLSSKHPSLTVESLTFIWALTRVKDILTVNWFRSSFNVVERKELETIWTANNVSPRDSLIHFTAVFEIHPVSGALEVFSSREIAHVVMLKTAWEHWPSFVNGRKRIVKSKMKKENLLGHSFKLLSGRLILERWHVEVREQKIHYFRTSNIHIHLKKFSWTSICRYAHLGFKTTTLEDLLALYNSMITCRLSCHRL